MTDSQWAWWRAQLAGDNPDTTPGQPHAGFYRNRRRVTFDDPVVGKRRKRVETYFEAVAIWREHNGIWYCLIESPRAPPRWITGTAEIDESVFCRCCRDALTYDEWAALVAQMEQDRAAA